MKKTELKEALECLENYCFSSKARKIIIQAVKDQLESMPDDEFIPPDGCPVEVGGPNWMLRISTGEKNPDEELICYGDHPERKQHKRINVAWDKWRLPTAVAIPWEAKPDSVNPVPVRRVSVKLENGLILRGASENFIWSVSPGKSSIIEFILLPKDW